jgi:catechol 2,3-dioxygenase-like lactoylglutathione lyase family enzyme
MRVVTAFVCGLVIGGGVMAVGAQGSRVEGIRGINHVGITVDNMEEAIAYYTKAFGFREGAVVRDDKGQPTLAFIQVSRDTFIELGPSTAERKAGIEHFGVEVDDAKQVAAALQARGLKVGEPRQGRTITFISNVMDPAGFRMEFQQVGPESMLGKAKASWK